jgi:flagellar protein FliS
MDPKSRYLEGALNAATPERKLQALLEAAVHFIARARKALADKAFDERHNCTTRAQDIYLELLVALDPEAGEYVANLQGLYYLLYDILVDANVRKDDARFAEAQLIAESIRDMWDEVILQAKTDGVMISDADEELAPVIAEPRLNIVG